MPGITNLKSSNRDRRPADQGGDVEVTVANGLRLRGAGGRLTVRLVASGVDQLKGRDWGLVGRAGSQTRRLPGEEDSMYGDRVVLKFGGIDDATGASEPVGQDSLVPRNGLVVLPGGRV